MSVAGKFRSVHERWEGATAQDSAAAALGREDCELMQQIACGSSDAFEELYDRYGARAYRVARSVCRDNACAEDAVQEAFASLWRTRSAYRRDRGPVAAWVLSLVRYRAIDIARRNGNRARRRAQEDMLGSHPAPHDTAGQALARADATRLYSLLDQIPDPQREVIVLAFYGQLTHIEIAAHLGLPLGTVKGRMRFGLSNLRDHIGQVGS